MAQPTDFFKLLTAFFHGMSKTATEAFQYVFESLYKSAHTVRADDVWSDTIPYCANVAAADAFVGGVGAAIVHKYTLQSLTEVPGSNGQAWYIDDTGTFIKSWVSPVDVPDTTTNAPSDGFQAHLFRADNSEIVPTSGVWVIDYYAGIVRFQAGSTPVDLVYGIPKITCYNYIGARGASGSANVDILDEGVAVITTNKLNFIGADVLATAGIGQTNIYIPPPAFPSHLTTVDGTTDALLASIVTAARLVSTPTIEGTPFKIGGWIGGDSHPCIVNAPLVFTTAENFRIFTNSGASTLRVRVYDADGVSVLAEHSVAINGNYVGPAVQNIDIQISGFAAWTLGFGADLSITIDMPTILPDGGRFTYEIVNTDNAVAYTKSQEMFADPNDTAAVVTGVSVIETVAGVIDTQISGVSYYTTGSEFTIDIADMDSLNDSSYPTTQVIVTGAELGLPALNLSGVELAAGGWDNKWDNDNVTYNNPAWTVNAVEFCNVSDTANVAATPQDWVAGAPVVSADALLCINTFTSNATGIYEDFKLETERLESDLATPWDNTQDLTAYDDNLGLQFQCSRLIYPQTDYSAYSPAVVPQPDYSGAAGARTFIRSFYHAGTSHSNGLIRFADHNILEADLTANNVQFELSLDGVAWFDLNANYLGGIIGDGDGCRINPDANALNINNSLEFTFGTGKQTDVGSGGTWGVFLRVTYAAGQTTKYIGSLEFSNWV